MYWKATFTLVFLKFVNDIANAVPKQKVGLLADDTNLFWQELQSRLLLVQPITQCLNGSSKYHYRYFKH